jgi:superfamily II DNA or RNA helicase/HKD family nuclease
MNLPHGLYEQLLTVGLQKQLTALDERTVQKQSLHPTEIPNRLALHLAKQIEVALDSLPKPERAQAGLELSNALLAQLIRLNEKLDFQMQTPVDGGSVLRSIHALHPDGSPVEIREPLIPLLDTTLLTNSPGEPRVGHQIVAEIDSARRIDVVMAFIRLSGILPMLPSLQDHIRKGGRIRVLTTTYTGSTQREALDRLADLGAEIRISYDISMTRLHAKAWLFERTAGCSTAYIGSSNLTHSAQLSGLEWNVRVSGARNPDVLDKVRAVFESYWESPDFKAYDPAEFGEQTRAVCREGSRVVLSPLAVELRPFQERLLEQIALARLCGHHRNLLVSATGTGKTVMSAVDYARQRSVLDRSRLLFVAHRLEILEQSQATFRHVLRDPLFGETWVAGRRPERFEHVFASIQTLHASQLDRLDPAHFDFVILDEFHHAAAASYRALLDHLRPRELVGLTATPERADGQCILGWFDGRIAAELRLWDAIDQQYLTPFHYFGIHDGVRLSEIPWKRGAGYDVDKLTDVYTASDAWAHFVIQEFVKRAGDLDSVRALGFCVSVRHARFMADKFNRAGIVSVAISAETGEEERRDALEGLQEGRMRMVFSVDLFNEGVDVPAVDALLMLRPTESGTLFLQQLGRGLRKREGKTVCTVLDFVGLHRAEFRFDMRLRALLGGSRSDVERQVENGFPFLPAGCHMELDRKASEIVLRSIRLALPTRWNQKVLEMRGFLRAGHAPELAAFLTHSGLELDDVFTKDKSWSLLCADAGLQGESEGPQETVLRRAIARLLHVDDGLRIAWYLQVLSAAEPPRWAELSQWDRRLIRMLLVQLCDQVAPALLPTDAGLEAALALLWEHPGVLADICALLRVQEGRLSHVHRTMAGGDGVPLRVHARYARSEILAAFGVGGRVRAETWREGVRWIPEERTDVFLITLDKTGSGFSPTTRYKDYAISRELFHWESQSMTSEGSPTGMRYRHQSSSGNRVVLFARRNEAERAFWCLGTASYVRHEGERPMAVTWRLHTPLPLDLFNQFAAAVA